MNITDLEITALKTQLEEWQIQLSLLAVKHQAAAEAALQFARELSELRARHHETSLKLRDLEMHQSAAYMWSNIGDGG